MEKKEPFGSVRTFVTDLAHEEQEEPLDASKIRLEIRCLYGLPLLFFFYSFFFFFSSARVVVQFDVNSMDGVRGAVSTTSNIPYEQREEEGGGGEERKKKHEGEEEDESNADIDRVERVLPRRMLHEEMGAYPGVERAQQGRRLRCSSSR